MRHMALDWTCREERGSTLEHYPRHKSSTRNESSTLEKDGFGTCI